MEAMEYEREAIKFDFDDWRSERRLSHAGFEDRNNFHGVIDRIDEEFGDDDANSLDTHVSGSYGRSPRSVSELPGVTGVVSSNHYLPSHQLYHAANAQFYDSELPATPFFKPYQQKYNDHTSQYASCDPAGYPYSIQVDSPGSPLLSGCYSDKTTAHGFFPPPPALPIPEFTQFATKGLRLSSQILMRSALIQPSCVRLLAYF